MTTQDREYDAVNSFALFSPPYPGERRETLRFRKESGTDYAVVLHPQESEGVVEVTDESLGGLAIVVDEAGIFRVGEAIELMYAGGFLKLLVRHVTRRSDGRYVVGFQE